MAQLHASRTKETSSTTGTATYELLGAVAGFRTFVAGIGTGNTCQYTATDGTDWEVGIGTVTDASPDTLARTTILASSNAGSAVSWGAGTRTLFVDAAAERLPVFDTTSEADGDFWYRESGVWVRKTTAQVHALTSGLVLLQRVTASSSASLDLTTGIGSTYDQYELHYGEIVVQTDTAMLVLRMSTDGGSNYAAGASDYTWNREGMTTGVHFYHIDGADSEIELGDCGNSTGESLHGRIVLPNLQGAKYKAALYTHYGYGHAPSTVRFTGTGVYLSTTAVDGLRLIPLSGNITSGWAALYGVRKA